VSPPRFLCRSTKPGSARSFPARGAGAVWAIELGGGRTSADVREELLTRGVIARPLGTTAVAFCPPLVITDAEVDRMVEATGEAARAASPA